ncbi:MAG TPA: hypothetical protein VFU23_14130 [Gemmatimonadales bacterium]|nr:hypothetical protein [Gemmatimonadales bacterium]
MQQGSRLPRRLLILLFVAGLLILLDQTADLIATILSRKADPSAANWRFGLFGLVASRTSALVVGDVMLFASVVVLGWRTMLKTLGALHLLLAVAALAGLVVFVLDAVQVKGGVPAQAAVAYSGAVFRAGVVSLVAALALGWAGVAAWRTARPVSRGEQGGSGSLMVGKKSGPKP